MTEEQAKQLAITEALIYPQGYMPENIEEFEPHRWVIMSILRAYNLGKDDALHDWKLDD